MNDDAPLLRMMTEDEGDALERKIAEEERERRERQVRAKKPPIRYPSPRRDSDDEEPESEGRDD